MYEWKSRFNKNTLAQGKEYWEKGRVVDLQEEQDKYTAGVIERRKFEVKIIKHSQDMSYAMSCQCPMARGGGKCKHMAAVLYAMEEEENREKAKEETKAAVQKSVGEAKQGKFMQKEVQQKENQQEELQQKVPEQIQQAEIPQAEPKKAEDIMQPAQVPQEADETEYIIMNRDREGEPPALKAPRQMQNSRFLEEYRYFDHVAIRSSMGLTQAAVKKGRELCEKEQVVLKEVEAGYGQYDDELLGEAIGQGKEGKKTFPIQIVFSRKEIRYTDCQCSECSGSYYYFMNKQKKCAYIAGMMQLIEKHLKEKNLGDATDKCGRQLLFVLQEQRANQLVSNAMGREESLMLVPRLTRKDNNLALSFKIGQSKLYVIRNLFEFYQNVRESGTATYGSNTQINHCISNFTEKGKEWIDYIGRVLQEEEMFTARMEQAIGYYRRNTASGTLAVYGWRLDELYNLLGEDGIEYESKESGVKIKDTLYCAEQNPKLSMTIRKNHLNSVKTFHGITVNSNFPNFFYGARTAYYVEQSKLCRVQGEFLERIRTIDEFTENGKLSFQVGRNHLSEFYYSVLPQLKELFEIREEGKQEIASYLPPQAEFVFYLDAENQNIICRANVRYGEEEFSLLDVWKDEPMEPYRERAREEEVAFLVQQWFPYVDEDGQELHCGQEEERMYQVLDKGVEALLALGEVQCTRRFSSLNIGRRVRMSVGVSVSRGLLNLNISTQDISQEELLDVLRSYRAKKKYHRLKNGDFLSLEDNSLETLDEMMEAMRLSPKELLKGNIHLPMYRALYLDKLLEKNEEIYANRDNHFRDMVKSFKTVNDADFEEPEALSHVMRGYQKNGYRWLRTLEEYHLGGILADDMGLGKTLQVIAVLLSARLEDRGGTSLVVAPASLVFNWGEEIRSFAPQLSCGLIIGNQEERQKKLEQYQNYDVIITSYDLLKRDISYYEDKEFDYQIIDEAQYIKNHTTAAAKAVKVIHSRTRYALTGTPIENRLSELWSIFDYLIPGYLYGYEVFRKEFEAPIVKNGEQAVMERLQRMTSPFILRRMKENVLKDLPDKLEENRYVKLDNEQQRLYDAQVLHMKQSIVMQDAAEFQKNKIQVLAELMKLRQICCDPRLCFENYGGESAKLEACLELVQSAVDGGHKILLFSQFTSMLELLQEKLKETGITFYTITGATSKEKRLEMVKAFNEDDTRVFLISLKAGGVGLNLTGADVVIHYDPWWNLAVQNQATDRAHRIGQTKKVVVYRLIVKGSIEEKIQQLQESKRALSEQIIQGDAGQLSGMSREDFLSMLEGK